MNRLWIFIIITGFPAISTNSSDEFDAKCYCSVFRSDDNPKWDDPLLISDPEIPISHNLAGYKSCARICKVLFVAFEKSSRQVICDIIQTDVNRLHVTPHFRLCDEETWATIKSSNREPICCKKGRSVPCDEP